jgi:TPR repeat protein
MKAIGTNENSPRAVVYFKSATDSDHGDAQMRYGMCLANGKGLLKNGREPARYCKIAADHRLAPAEALYGR